MYDKRFLCAALTVHCAMAKQVITREEADLILLTVKKAQENAIEEHVDVKAAVNKRAAVLVCIFNHLFYFIHDIVKTLAFDDVEVLPKFDAYYFNELFVKMEAMTVEQKTVLLEEANHMCLL
jgi:hypothetical protein